MLLHILTVSITFCEIIILSVGLANVVELVLVEGRTHHYAAHLEVLMILLMKISLLTTGLFAEKV